MRKLMGVGLAPAGRSEPASVTSPVVDGVLTTGVVDGGVMKSPVVKSPVMKSPVVASLFMKRLM